jgi:transcriptional regulator with PAS, ATPase and Fis domain
MTDESTGLTDPLSSSADHLIVQKYSLRVIAGSHDVGRTFVATGDRTVIGTHESVDLVLRDSTMSRFHCEIVLAEKRAVIRDLDSKNGTLVNGVSVLSALLTQNATLTLGRTQLAFELTREQIKIPLGKRERFGLLVGRSPAMRTVFQLLERAAASDSTVLLLGETGVGKDVAAESVHRESARKEGPFVVVDCGAIPPNLLESELFGYEKGAFTGADRAHVGAFEAAAGGTIFLDEIGELSLELQPKLLRALERHEVRRIGGTKWIGVDVRVIAATNRDLRADVNQKRFRSDLYYRLAVLEVHLPPLRARLEDLGALVEALLASLGVADQPAGFALRSSEFLTELRRHAWPGNVRELKNYLERCLAFKDETPIAPASALGQESGDGASGSSIFVDISRPLREVREQWARLAERRYIERALEHTKGNVTMAARIAQVDRIHFYRILSRCGLR